MALVAKELREVGGQLIYTRPWHCSLCRRRYKARHLIEFWEETLTRTGKKYRKDKVRLCRGDEVQPRGCAEMGFQRLFFRARRQTHYRPRKG